MSSRVHLEVGLSLKGCFDRQTHKPFSPVVSE